MLEAATGSKLESVAVRLFPLARAVIPMDRSPVARLAATLGILWMLSPCALDAQFVRGSVRTFGSSLPIPAVQVQLRDTLGRILASTTSDEQGLFALRSVVGQPFSVQARRLGFQMAETDVLRFSLADTLDLEFSLSEVTTELDEVEVTGMMPLNQQRLEEAQRRGWQVYDPETVAMHRDRASDLEGLLRSVGAQSLILPRSTRECIRNTRTIRLNPTPGVPNQGCVTYIVDGQVLGTERHFVLPQDIYFVAILSPSQSRAQYGSRAMDGAIAIFTRARGDRTDRPAPLPPRGSGRESRPPAGAPPPPTRPPENPAPSGPPPTRPPR